MHNACPDCEILGALLAGRLADAEQAATEAHVEYCARCQDQLQELADVASILPANAIPPELRGAAGSQRLDEVIRALGKAAPSRGTIVSGPDTDVVPLGGASDGRSAFGRRPERIGDYDVQAVLGRGGVGLVYRATDRVLARDVAIKVLRSDLADNEPMRERFLREARAVAAIRHDHVVAIYGVGDHAEQPYLVMEYVPGGSLAARLLRKGKLSCAEVVTLGIEVAAGLAAAHAKGIVHRDVKPGNVLWDAETARYKLTDFGLAKALDEVGLTQSGIVAGTPEYLSPEQAEGGAVDGRSDLFSLGAMLYAAAAGQSPFHADSTMGVLHRVRSLTPPNLQQVRADCPADLAIVIDRLLAKNPSDRYSSAAGVVEALRRIDGQSGESPPTTHRGPVGADSRRRARRLAAAATLVLAIVAGAFWLTRLDRETLSAPDDAAATPPRGAFVVAGVADGFDSLADAVAAAPANGVIEVHGNAPLSIEPVRIEKKPLVIRAARGSRPVIVPAGGPTAVEPAFTTDSDLTLEGLEIRWAVGTTSRGPVEAATAGSAVKATGGTLRLDHCELTVGRRDACVALVGAACSLNNSRLSALDGLCVAWRPRAGDRLQVQNCVLAGQCCLSINAGDEPGDLPASLESSHNTWQGRKGLQLNVVNASRRSLSIRTDQNLFAVDHLFVLFWPFRGPRAVTSPSLDLVRSRLRGMIAWQEKENHYGAATRLLSRQSPRQPLTAVDDSPKDIAAWEAFWNRPGSGSRQGAASAAELSGKAGADESEVGPAHSP